jgi:hypothetical protein
VVLAVPASAVVAAVAWPAEAVEPLLLLRVTTAAGVDVVLVHL